MSLLDDLRGLMLEINGGSGTSRKPMRLGDGAALSRLERALALQPHYEEACSGYEALLNTTKLRWTLQPGPAAWLAAEAKRKEQTNG